MEITDYTPKIIDNISFNYCCSPNDPYLAGHSHIDSEIVAVVEGSFEHVYENIVITLIKGDVLIIPPNTFHLLKSNRTPKNKAFIIQAEIANIKYLLSPKIYKMSEDNFTLLNIIRNDIQSTVTHSSHGGGFGGYTSAPRTLTESTKKLIESWIQRVLTQENRIPDFVESKQAFIYNQAINYMKENLQAMLSIDEISEHCNTSPSTLKNTFRTYSNSGVITHFIELKISSAKKFIESGKPISYISDYLGFSSQSYFSQTFKRITGLSPLEYKKSIK